MNLVPRAIQPYLKAWVSLLGVIVSALVTAWADVPRWVTIVGAVLSALAVYLTPNTPTTYPPATDGTPSATGIPEPPA